jgi:general secretion pathway protein D
MAQPLIKIKKVTMWILCSLWLVAIVWKGASPVWAQGVPPSANEPANKFISDQPPPDSDRVTPGPGRAVPGKLIPNKLGPNKLVPGRIIPDKEAHDKDAHKKVSMDFDNVDIRLVIKFMSDLTGKNFILDDRVKGKVTVLSPTQIPVKDAFKIFESILEVNGYTTVTSGNIIKVIPDNNAASKNLETISGDSHHIEQGEDSSDTSDTMVTQLIPLQFADVERVKAILQALISRESKILSYLPTNTLILTERASNINRLMTILKEIDVETENSVIEIIPVQNGDADTMVKQLQTFFGERTSYYRKTQNSKGGQIGDKVKILSDSRTDSIIVMADPEQIEEIKDLVKQLDIPVPRDKDDIHVYFLRNAKADDMAKVLAQIMSKTLAKGVKEAKPDTPITVVSDKSTNSLIITASTADYTVIGRVLQKLDIMRPQVLVEALIAEVSYNKSRELGVEWRAMREPSDKGSLLPLGGTSFGAINNVMTPTGAIAPPGGLFIGLTKGFIEMGGVSFPNLAALLAAYQTDSDVNVLSTPHILTTDNEEAEIIVGEEVPYAGAREVLPNSGTSSSVYSYNYKNVGLTLRLTPHINQDDYVKLEIYQEIKKVVDTAVSSEGPLPTTTIRQAKTTVVVKDGQTVVLGGLIQDDKMQTSQRVPCLGSIPLLGMLFRSTSKKGEKRNLQIFITPHIIKNPEDIDVFTRGMRNKLEEQEQPQSKTKRQQQTKTKQQQLKTEQQQIKTEQQQPKAKQQQQKKNEPQQPETEQQQPKAGQQQIKVKQQQPKTEQQQPKAEPQQPKTEQQQPKAEQQQPETEQQQPKAEPQQPEAEQQQPKNEQQQPKTEQQQPETEQQQPKNGQQQPETEQQQPKNEQQQPEPEQ